MICLTCKKKFREGDRVIPVSLYVGNEKRGDFVSDTQGFVHLACVAVSALAQVSVGGSDE